MDSFVYGVAVESEPDVVAAVVVAPSRDEFVAGSFVRDGVRAVVASLAAALVVASLVVVFVVVSLLVVVSLVAAFAWVVAVVGVMVPHVVVAVES